MPLSDAEVVAMLADMEALRVEVTHERELLGRERERTRELTDEVGRLDRHLAAAMERQRELHVLLLHRDQELAALRTQRPPGPAAGVAPALAAPASAASPSPTVPGILVNAWSRLRTAAGRPPR
jgi:hypothetical protein